MAKDRGRVISLMPFLLFGFLYFWKPDYALIMFRDPVGIKFVVGGLISWAWESWY